MSRLITLEQTASTNSYIREHMARLSDGDAVSALVQTAGRGRRGHSWTADDGALAMSVLLRKPPYPAAVTLCAGLAVCEAIESFSSNIPKAKIKWPNDVIIGGFKVCGILCESVVCGDNFDVICGIGVNISQSRECFDAAGLTHAASLMQIAGIAPNRNELALAIIGKLREHCKNGFPQIRECYRDRCLNLGREVRIISENGEKTAFAEDVSENGFLICHDENGVFEVNAGEVSVRGLLGYI